MDGKTMMLALCLLLVPLLGRAQEIREQAIDILPADNDSTLFSDPDIQQNVEQWLLEMPTTIARNPESLLDPVEPDFLSKAGLKDEPNYPTIDWKGLMCESKIAKTNFQLGKMGQWWQAQKQVQAGGAMTVGVSVSVSLGTILKKIFGNKKQKRREKLQQILDEY